ncbi:MAG: class I SAM-dependent methyltransferase [Methylocella sp.]
MSNLFRFRGFDIPVDLIQKTGAGPEAFEPIADNQVALLQEYIGVKDTDHVMEIGCGIGRGAIPLTKLLEHGHYIGTDLIAPSIQWCTENISIRFPNFVFVHHDIQDTLNNPTGTLQACDVRLPAEDDSTDLIILQSVFTHMFPDEIVHYMKEFRRILKPTGRVWATFFIVHQGILDAIRNNAQTQYALSFQHPYGLGCYINFLDEPRGAVAFEEDALKQVIELAGLTLAQPILWGAWSSQRPDPKCGQDSLVLMKPNAPDPPTARSAASRTNLRKHDRGAQAGIGPVRSIKCPPRQAQEGAMQEQTGKPQIPPVLDFNYYRSANADLRNFTDDELLNHFEHYGMAEGRAGAPQSFSEQFLTLISQTVDTLEIGPFCRPQMRGDKVRYFDIAGREELIERAKQVQYPIMETPVIDYVSPTGDLGIINDQFDQVFSSHCIEHQPDLVRHLSQVSRILRDGGNYFLIVPDKRFCFDHFLSESTIADVLGAHIEQRRLHCAKSILEISVLRTHNDPVKHWHGDHGLPVAQQQGLECIKSTIDQIVNNAGVYLDTHAWHFTPSTFQDILSHLYQLGLSKLRVERIYNTPVGRFEFCAILSKG